MKIRIKDIADRAGVSTGTVDRVLHKRGEVSAKTRDKVMGILKEMEYQPDILARSLASRNPLRIAVLLPYYTPENWFWKEPLTGIANACLELNHFKVEVKEYLYDQFSKEDFVKHSNEVLAWLPDAVIAAPVFFQETEDFFNKCSQAGIPFASINDNLSHPSQLSYVGQDPARSGAVAAQLIQTGLNGEGCILLISIARDRDNNNHILNREKGFRQYWRNNTGNDLVKVISHSISKDTHSHIEKSLEGLFKKHQDIRGIFVTNSRVYQVASFIHQLGRNDIMLVGYDLIEPNIDYLNRGTIDFLISQKPREQGYLALMTVFNELRLNKKPSPEQLIPIDIICKENLCCYQV